MNKDLQRQTEIERRLAKQKRKKAAKPASLPTKREHGKLRIDKYIDLISTVKKKDQRRQEAIARKFKHQEKSAAELALKSKIQQRRFRRSIKRKAFLRECAHEVVTLPHDWHPEKPLILFLSYGSDYTFLCYTLAECLKVVGVDAKAVTRRHSPSRPLNQQAPAYSQNDVARMVENANVIVWMHSLMFPVPGKFLENTKCVVFHGGTRYRRSYRDVNQVFKNRVHLSLVQTGELLGRGAHNEHWFLPPVDTKTLKPDYSFVDKNKLVIGHFSSHLGKGIRKSHVKGTPLIVDVVKKLKQTELGTKFEFRVHGDHIVPWKDNLKRMAQCDIYIESLSQAVQTSKNRHDWSIQALEACSLGCITVTNFLFEERYLDEYGKHGLIVANTERELTRILTKLIQTNRGELLKLKHKARQWVEEMHSFEVVGKRLKNILGI